MPRVAGAEAALGRLAVDQKPRAAGRVVRQLRAVAAALLADDEQQADAGFAFAPQAIDRGDLRGENALRVARAAAVEPIAVDAARKKRRHAIEVRGQHHRRATGARTNGRDDVAPLAVHRLLGDLEPKLAQMLGEPPARFRLHVRLSNRCR